MALRFQPESHALSVVQEILLAARSRILTVEDVALINDAADDDFEIELIDIRRVCDRASRRVRVGSITRNSLEESVITPSPRKALRRFQ